MTLSCTTCQSEYEDWYSQGRCMDCGSQLRNDVTGELIALPEDEDNDDDVPLEEWVEQRETLPVATSHEIPGFELVSFHGDVMGITVLAGNTIARLTADARKHFGGEVGPYVKMLSDGRKVALSRMRSEALSRGANAVIAMRMDANQMSDAVTELIAYGTAVTIRAIGSID
jgi:uncharacterized protein YbjQ (UPF0145 family)